MPSAQLPKAYSYVRMSTDRQLKGDSLRRQLDKSRAYAAEHNFALMEQFRLEDLGISAFKGANADTGALGKFLGAVRAGTIEKGSYLLVESLDRLSRQQVMKSLGIFTEIINAGINIATLADGRIYEAEKTEFAELILSIAIMSRAHEESSTKSYRGGAVWANKRKNAGGQKLTAQCPGWLKLSSDKIEFDVIESRATIIRSIFEDSAAGLGNYSIARRLNENAVPTFGRADGWQNSYVAKLLGTRAVLGEFQPHRIVDGKRRAEGEVLPAYFPKIIEEDLFYRAQGARHLRRVKGGGRKGEYVSNLFSQVASCEYCGSSMRFINKGPKPKGGLYLVCGRAHRGLDCQKAPWRYDQFETSFLAFVREIDIEQLIEADSQLKSGGGSKDELTRLRGEVGDIERQTERAYELFQKSGAAADFVATKLNDLQQRRLQIELDIRDKEALRDVSNLEAGAFAEGKQQIKALISRVSEAAGDEKFRLRTQIAGKLKGLVARISLAPLGASPEGRRLLAEINSKSDPSDSINEAERKYAEQWANDHRRYFRVTFKNGTIRTIYQSGDDPFQFDEEHFETSKGIHKSRNVRGEIKSEFEEFFWRK